MRFTKLSKALVGVTLAAVLAVGVSAEFSKTLTYNDGQFTDVKADAWYAKEVKSAFELGFMNGTAETLFSPDGSVTVAQGITMAARINALNRGQSAPENSKDGNWYDNAVKYALENGIIAEGDFDSYTRPIKRSEMAELVYDSMPRDAFKAQNSVYAIPDVADSADYTQKLLVLYNAGIVMGSDGYGNFYPDNDIKRSECAAIINRVAIPENRLQKTLLGKSDEGAYTLVYNTGYTGNKEGINSGWVYDNRGGVPMSKIEENYGSLNDISDEFGTAMIREFNEVFNGTVVTETTYTVMENGFFVEFRDNTDKTVYQIKLIDNSWQILGADGKYSVIAKDVLDGSSAKIFKLRLYIDLDNKKSTTYINDVNCGTYDLLGTNLLNYRYATDEKSKLSVSAGVMNMVVNYNMYEDFDTFYAEKIYNWTTTEGVTARGTLNIPENGEAKKTFKALNAQLSAQTYFILPNGGNASYSLMSGDKAIVTFEAKDGAFVANGKTVYDKYTKNMWYRLRIDADLATGKADILLNGRSVGVVSVLSAGAVDGVAVKAQEGAAIKFDEMKVYADIKPDDYVPAPTTRASLDDYVVGLNICSLWRNGTHFGWACISPYDEPKTVLGYYDEGNPESADWEIKYMVEHGIDFQAFCWYSDASTTPVKNPRNSPQLHEGYMYADYSDYMKYTIIWEAANASPFKSQAFREHIVPYWFENYFLDDRYLKLDNNIVLCIFGLDKLYGNTYFGSIENAKAEFDYLDEVAKSYGFDGVIVLASSTGNPSAAAQMGVEGMYAYNWGTEGSQINTNKNGMLNSAKNQGIYTVPTVSVGFDSIPWHGERHPNMTVEDYKTINEWVKSDYLPKYSKAGTWNERLVMLSTWNEYGEGTYIMPSGLNGFGYLDVIRDSYTELATEHTDIVPVHKQTERFNHLYAQYARLLRHEGWFKNADITEADLESIYKLEYSPTNASYGSIVDVTMTDEGVAGKSKSDNNDPIIRLGQGHGINASDVKYIDVTLKVPNGQKVEMFFITEADPNWNQAKCMSFVADSDELKTYTVPVTNKDFKGPLADFRIDPVNTFNTPFVIKDIDFKKVKASLNRKLFVNGLEYNSDVAIKTLENGEVLIPFDPATGLAYALNVHFTWRKGPGTLRVEGNNHVVDYLVGSDKYTVDGKEKTLSYILYTEDGLPMLAAKQFAEDLGYEYTLEEEKVSIKTPQNAVYESQQNRVLGTWNFNDYDTEGWASQHMSLFVANGSLTMTTLDDNHNDPIMTMNDDIILDSKRYTDAEIKCRYNYKSEGPHNITIYFLTDKDGNWNEAKKISFPMKSTDSGEDWDTIKVSLSDNKGWANNITKLRFDPFNAAGTMEVDYLKFIEDPDYVYVDPATLPYEIENGDAENAQKATAFFSDNATISIVEDPRDKTNHVYNVTPKAGKNWTYFRQAARFKAGYKYKISYDICLVSDSVQTGAINCNLRYPEEGALNGKDHVVFSSKLNKGEWTHVEFEHVVNSTNSANGHEFTIYANPEGEVSLGYMVDNIVVVEEAISVDTDKKADVQVEKPATGAVPGLKDAGIVDGAVPFSDNAVITYSEEEKAYVVTAKEGKVWTYFRNKAPLVSNKTYVVTFDVKLTGDNTGAEDVSTTIQINFRYPDADGKNDHVAKSLTKLSTDDGWVHVEDTFTTADITARDNIQCAVYANPVNNENGTNYMIKNFKLVEQE